MKFKFAVLGMSLLSLSACATPPSSESLDALPVIDFGNVVPAGSDYILHFPAGKAIPTDVRIGGDLLEHPAQQTLTVKLNRDIYSYKQWVSYDKQHWVQGNDAIALKLDVKIPSYTYPQAGHIKLDVSKKE